MIKKKKQARNSHCKLNTYKSATYHVDLRTKMAASPLGF